MIDKAIEQERTTLKTEESEFIEESAADIRAEIAEHINKRKNIQEKFDIENESFSAKLISDFVKQLIEKYRYDPEKAICLACFSVTPPYDYDDEYLEETGKLTNIEDMIMSKKGYCDMYEMIVSKVCVELGYKTTRWGCSLKYNNPEKTYCPTHAFTTITLPDGQEREIDLINKYWGDFDKNDPTLGHLKHLTVKLLFKHQEIGKIG